MFLIQKQAIINMKKLKTTILTKRISCIIYARVSTNEQSCDAQITQCKQTAKQYGWDILEIINEKQSGQDIKRNGLNLAISYAKQHKCKLILVKDASRISRNPKHYFMIEEKLRKINTQIFQVDFPTPIYDNNFDRKYSDDLLIAGSIPTFMSKLEINELVKKTRNGMRQRTLKGIFHHDIYGYKTQYIGSFKSKGIVDSEASIIRKCYDWCIEGYGFTKIAKTLNELGHLTRNNELFASTNIREILKNQIYYGRVEYRTIIEKPETWVTVEPDYTIYEPIITKQIFDEAQNAIENRRYCKSSSYSNTIFHKSKILKCGVCGFSHTVVHKNGRYKTSCNKSTLGKGCTRNSVQISSIQKKIYAKLKNIFTSKERCFLLIRKIIESDFSLEKKQKLYDFMQDSLDLLGYLERPIYDELVVEAIKETLQRIIEVIYLKSGVKGGQKYENIKIIFTVNVNSFASFLTPIDKIEEQAQQNDK